MLFIGILVCLGGYVAGRALARRLLDVPGMRLLSKQADGGYFDSPPARRVAFRLAGPTTAYVVCVLLAFASFRANGERIMTTTVDVRSGGPAAAAGMQSGDRILAVDGVASRSWPDVLAAVGAAGPDRRIAIRVARGSAELPLVVTTNAAGRIQIVPVTEDVSKPVGRALSQAVALPVTELVRRIHDEATTAAGGKQDLMGPVGIVREVSNRPARPVNRLGLVLMMLAFPAAVVWPMSLLLELFLWPRRPRRA